MDGQEFTQTHINLFGEPGVPGYSGEPKDAVLILLEGPGTGAQGFDKPGAIDIDHGGATTTLGHGEKDEGLVHQHCDVVDRRAVGGDCPAMEAVRQLIARVKVGQAVVGGLTPGPRPTP